ncbi:MAG: acyl-CoA desaturase [Thermoanaerobaculia bacterium]
MPKSASGFEARTLRRRKRHVLLITVVPLVGFVVAVVMLWRKAVGPLELGLLAGMWTLSGLAGTVGFHRLFAHRSFQARTSVRVALAVAGSMAGQGPPIYWAALHRQHHQFSDQEGDPHSPHLFGDSFLAMVRGLWHAHIGWMFRHDLPDSSRYTPDLLQDPVLAKVNRLYFVWLAIGLAIPAGIGGLVHGSWLGAWYGFLWGGLARLFLGEHLIWSVNSLCHFFGTRPFRLDDHSANNTWMSVLTMGESLHNNHHAFPGSARFGLRWWQLDPGDWLIWSLERLGLVWGVKRPSKQTIVARMAR